MEKASVRFMVSDQEVKFDVQHNLSEYGMDIENAVMSWAFRTKNYTGEYFCEYVKSKDYMLKCKVI
jgi:hypothetical protein